MARRPVPAAAVCLVVVFTVAAAVSGPLLLRAVEQSALRAALVGAAPGVTDIAVSARMDPGPGMGSRLAAARNATDAAGQFGLYGPPVETVESADPLRWAPVVGSTDAAPTVPAVGGVARLAARTDGCVAFPLVVGRCATGNAEVTVPAGALRAGRVRLGGSLRVTVPGAATSFTFLVVGGYDSARSTTLLPGVGDPLGGAAAGTAGPDLLVSAGVLTDFTAPVVGSSRVTLLVSRLGLDQVPAARASVSAVQQATLGQGVPLAFDAGLPGVLDAAAADRRAAGVLLVVLTTQAVGVALFAAMVVMSLVARVRSPEWALDRLRGLPARRRLAGVFAEPVALLMVGTAVGFTLAVVACRAVAAAALPAGARLEPGRAPVLICAAVAVAGLVTGLVAASWASARAPLATLLREGTDRPRSSRFAVAGEALVVAVAGAAVYQLIVGGDLGGGNAGLGLFAPGLLTAAVGLLAIRVVTARMRHRTSTPARSLAAVLVLRPLARTASVLRLQVCVAIGVALVVFATQVAALSGHNQSLRAAAQVGASSVWHVQVPAGVNLTQVIGAADPGGTAAMAVEERAAPGDGGLSRVLAVDTSRLARISPWRSSWAHLSSAQLAARLHPATPPPVLMEGRQVTVTVTEATISLLPTGDSSAAATRSPPQLVLTLADTAGDNRWQDVALGPLRPGNFTLRADMTCPHGCRLVRVALQNTSPTPFTADLTIAAIGTDIQPASAFAPVLRDASRWRGSVGASDPSQPVRATVGAGIDGLHVSAQNLLVGSDQSPAIAPTDVPSPLPGLLAAGLDTQPVGGSLQGTGLDGQPQPVTAAGRAAVLPRALDDGVLVDLGYARALSDPAHDQASREVWLAPGTHPGIDRALTAAGIRVVGRETLATHQSALSDAAPGRAVVVGLAVAAGAAVLVLNVLAAARLIDAAARRTVWAVARASGVSTRRMAVLVAADIGAPAAAATLVGVGSGLLAVTLARSRVPLFAAGTIGPPRDTSLNWLVLLAVVGAGAVVLAVTTVLLAGQEAARLARRSRNPS